MCRTSRPALPLLASALNWESAPARAIALETLVRACAPSNRYRESIVGAALGRGLPALLLAELNAVASRSDQEARVLRVVMVDLLRALSAPGMYGTEVRRILEGSPIWARESRQRHDLFLPANASMGLIGGGGAASILLQGSSETLRLLTAPPVSRSSRGAEAPSLHGSLSRGLHDGKEAARQIAREREQPSTTPATSNIAVVSKVVDPAAVLEPTQNTPATQQSIDRVKLPSTTTSGLEHAPTFEGVVPERERREGDAEVEERSAERLMMEGGVSQGGVLAAKESEPADTDASATERVTFSFTEEQQVSLEANGKPEKKDAEKQAQSAESAIEEIPGEAVSGRNGSSAIQPPSDLDKLRHGCHHNDDKTLKPSVDDTMVKPSIAADAGPSEHVMPVRDSAEISSPLDGSHRLSQETVTRSPTASPQMQTPKRVPKPSEERSSFRTPASQRRRSLLDQMETSGSGDMRRASLPGAADSPLG